MSVIDEIREDRQDLANVLEKYSGIRKVVEEAYPDKAHFLFELLQNAEDTKAAEASFVLHPDSLIFEHNGRPFSRADVEGITNIGEGTKEKDEDTIGRFGVGFKAVFAFSETPSVFSPTFSFRIERLVLPWEIESEADLGCKTRFVFPFNNPKKDAAQAYAEVSEGLLALSEVSLLFLSHLESIDWEIEGKASGQILRLQHSENHIEVLRQDSSGPTNSAHLLRFEEPVEGLPNQRIAIAYPLKFLPDGTKFDRAKPLDEQMRIAPADIGQVAVFFPAEKETSGLRYHLHAPFVPELSRASVKETAANTPLFDQLARLSASSLYKIRDLGLLNAEALGILPNKQDSIPKRYQTIMQAVIAELNDNDLTPTQDRNYAPAKHLLQTKAVIKEVLSDKDLEVLTDFPVAPRWAASAPQKNSNADRLLSSLAIREWEFDDLISAISERAGPYCWKPAARDEFLAWLASKPDEWLQQFYSLLHRELAQEYYGASRLSDARIVKLRDGTFSTGKASYFPSNTGDDEGFPRVDPAVYTSGKSKAHQSAARKFLEEVGVSEVGEAEQVEAILEERYTRDCACPDEKTHLRDLRRFIALVENDPSAARMFHSYYILACGDDEWRKPKEIFLDLPFLETGLSSFYAALDDAADRYPLGARYLDCGIALKRIASFAKAIGAQVDFSPSETSTRYHPEASKLWTDYAKPGTRWTDSAIDEDWEIDGLEHALESKSELLSRLVWKSMCSAPPRCLQAKFRPNKRYDTRVAPSSLILVLRSAEWIPQTDGSFVRPSKASRDLLPPGFAFDPGQQWLKAVNFGEETAVRLEKERQKAELAKELGFKDKSALEDAKKFAEADPEERKRILDELDRRASFVLPEQNSNNPERRSTRVGEQASEAPEKTSEERTRSVQVGLADVKAEAEQYLRRQYTNADGETICQICKAPLPFKLDDGRYYLEKVELIRDIGKRHFQNYLALCPNHAAMYQHAHGSADLIRDLLIDCDSDRLDIILAGKDEAIYFTEVHLLDLKAILSPSHSASSNDDRRGAHFSRPQA
jgi:hypothetical protein